MSMYEFNAINRIAETFEEKGIPFRIYNDGSKEELEAPIAIDEGPSTHLKFIARDDDNDIRARIPGLITKIPKEKRPRVMEACNILNQEVTFIQFLPDTDGNIFVKYDFLTENSDNCIGPTALSLFYRTDYYLNLWYPLFMKALYSEEPLKEAFEQRKGELISKMQQLFDELPEKADGSSVIEELFNDLDDDCEMYTVSFEEEIGHGATEDAGTDSSVSIDWQRSFAELLRQNEESKDQEPMDPDDNQS